MIPHSLWTMVRVSVQNKSSEKKSFRRSVPWSLVRVQIHGTNPLLHYVSRLSRSLRACNGQLTGRRSEARLFLGERLDGCFEGCRLRDDQNRVRKGERKEERGKRAALQPRRAFEYPRTLVRIRIRVSRSSQHRIRRRE